MSIGSRVSIKGAKIKGKEDRKKEHESPKPKTQNGGAKWKGA